MSDPRPRTAVVLFNLGGPDRPESVEPFLFNLFYDPAIVGLPNPLRWLVAKLVSRRRAGTAGEIYARLGGGSPLLPNTEAQARALEGALGDLGETRVFIAMRYWHPLTEETVQAVAAFRPERVVLLPLYPQFSTTTTASSVRRWQLAAARAGLAAPTTLVCCYPVEEGFVAASAAMLGKAIATLPADMPWRVLFSAHGLPERVLLRGDPYCDQIEVSAAAVARAAGLADGSWLVSYQSRVGPLKWVGPATDDEIRRAGAEGVALVVLPIAFVSEHSETLVELDEEYAHLASEVGVPAYRRVPTVSSDPTFVAGLAGLVRRATEASGGVCPHRGWRCSAARRACPRLAENAG